MKTKSTEVKTKLEKLHKDISWQWNIIRSENKVEKGYKRRYDMKSLLEDIFSKAEERIQCKLDQLCINMGFKSRADLPKDCIYPTIFKLSEINEQYVQIGIIIDKATIDSSYKMKKGKKNLKEEEELTRDFLNKMKNNLQLQIIDLKKKLADFNDAAELDLDKAYMYLAA